MKLYKERYLFKPFLRNSKNYQKYYNSLITSFKLPKLNKSQSETFLNISKKKGNIDDYKDNDNQPSKINKINTSKIALFKSYINNKIRNNSTIRKQLFYNNNSSLIFNFRNNIKKLKIKSKSYLSNSDKSSMSCIINFFNDYEKEFFPDIDYSNLKYNDYEIYKDKYVYENLIKEKVKYLKNNKNLNPTTKFEKSFFYGKYKKEIDLTFFDTLSVIDIHDMLDGYTQLVLIELYNIKMYKIITTHNMFENKDILKYIDLINVNETSLNLKDDLIYVKMIILL
jgi:hypothetical protein